MKILFYFNLSKSLKANITVLKKKKKGLTSRLFFLFSSLARSLKKIVLLYLLNSR